MLLDFPSVRKNAVIVAISSLIDRITFLKGWHIKLAMQAQGYPQQGYPPQGTPMQVMQQPGQQPGMPSLAPVLVEVPPNCPPGLEYLALVDNIYIKEQTSLAQMITGIDMKRKFLALNAAFQQIMFIHEESDLCARYLCGSLRPLSLFVHDNTNRVILEIDRPFAPYSIYHPFVLPVNFCWLQKMTIKSPLNGQVLGYIRQNPEVCSYCFSLLDAAGAEFGRIHGPCIICNCGNDIEFPIENGGVALGSIIHKWGGFVQLMANNNDYHVVFPLNMPVEQKAILLAACLLMDYCFFEKKNDNQNQNI